MKIAFNITTYTLITARRDWLYLGLFVVLLFGFSFSMFMANTAMVEQRQMSLVYMASSVRFVSILGLVLFVAFHIRRSFENKEVEFLLSKPISRSEFILSYYIAFVFLAASLIFPAAFLIYAFAWLSSFEVHGIGILLWAISLFFEAMIVMAFAFMTAITMQSAVISVIATLLYYVLCRVMGFFLIAINSPVTPMKASEVGRFGLEIVNALSFLFPRMDMFSESAWVIYGVPDLRIYTLFVGSTLVYAALLLAVAMYDFRRKEF